MKIQQLTPYLPPCSDLVLKRPVRDTAAAFQQLMSQAAANSTAAGSTGGSGVNGATEATNTTAGSGSSNVTISPGALQAFVNDTMEPAGR